MSSQDTNGAEESGGGWKKASKVMHMVRASQVCARMRVNKMWIPVIAFYFSPPPNSSCPYVSTHPQGFRTLRDMLPEDVIIDSSRLAVQKQLGEGGFAFVNLALLDGAKPVAVKTLKPHLLESVSDVEMFLKETELMRKLKNMNVVDLIGVGGKTNAAEGAFIDLYIVQEYCPGGSLKDVVFQQMITPHRPLYTNADALRWCLGLAKALNYLHTAKPKVIHRDLKLDNVILSDKKFSVAQAKLADFGLAKLVASSKRSKHLRAELDRLNSKTEKNWNTLQRKRSMSVNRLLVQLESMAVTSLDSSTATTIATDMTGEAGSYSYMVCLFFGIITILLYYYYILRTYLPVPIPVLHYNDNVKAPEVLNSDQYDEKADIFSFAMVMYNLFYRVIPSVLLAANGGESDDVAVLAYRTANGYRPTLGTTNVPAEVNSLINKCWSGVPQLRPTAAEVVKELEVITGLGVCKGGAVVEGGGGGEGGAKAGCSCSLM